MTKRSSTADEQRDKAVLVWLHDLHPELWRLSFEVDTSLSDAMLALTPTERLQAAYNFARLWESGHGPSTDR